MDENFYGLNENQAAGQAEPIQEPEAKEATASYRESASQESAAGYNGAASQESTAGYGSAASQESAASYESGTAQNTYQSMNMQGPSWQPGTGSAYQSQPQKKKKKEKKPVTTRKVASICAVFMGITLVANAAVTYTALKLNIGNYVTADNYNKGTSIKTTGDSLSGKSSVELATTDGTVADNDSTELSVSDVAEAMLPAVVSITSTSIYQSSSNPFSFGGTYQVSGAGSGIIIGTNDTELLIVTNNHVVEDTTSLTIEFVDGSSVEASYVKGTNSSNDLAVVAVNLENISEETIGAISIATLGDSDELSVGDQVVAIGNALGYGQSVTVGYVSALNRSLTVDNSEISVIQTDASINGGNSGGALINMKGEVVGINFAKESSSSSSSASIEGMGYAIPISQAKDIISDLMNKEPKVEVDEDEKGYIGITSAVSIDSTVSQMYNIPEGALLKGIADGSPADKAGIQIQDVIVAVNGDEISSYEDLQEEMMYYAIGDTVTITVERAQGNRYESMDFEVTLCSYEELEKLIDND